MSVEVAQLHCPFCNAALEARPGPSQACEYCLQPFTIVDARREEDRLLDEVKGWLAQKLGSLPASGGVDATSRSFIFQQRLLPDLRRDVDRSLEVLGGHRRFPLVLPPLATPNAAPVNPLLAQRRSVLGLKSLRARLASPQVESFAVSDADRASVQGMDRRLAEVLHLSNVAEASSRKDAAGYASSRKNLEATLAEVRQSLATEARSEPALARFLGAMAERYGALVELCRISEELLEGGAGAEQLDLRLESVAARLRAAASELEAADHDPSETMPMVLAAQQEAIGAALLRRWLLAWGAIARSGGPGFAEFLSLFGAPGADVPPDLSAEHAESQVFVLRAARREVAVPVLPELGWVNAWSEATRHKKTFGLFGLEEAVAAKSEFLLPLWVAELTFARAEGGLFKQGVEGRALALVDACAPAVEKVVFVLDPGHAWNVGLTQAQVLPALPLAMPASVPSSVLPIFLTAARALSDLKNVQVRVRGLAFAAACAVTFESSKGRRIGLNCQAGAIALGPDAWTRLQRTQELSERFS